MVRFLTAIATVALVASLASGQFKGGGGGGGRPAPGGGGGGFRPAPGGGGGGGFNPGGVRPNPGGGNPGGVNPGGGFNPGGNSPRPGTPFNPIAGASPGMPSRPAPPTPMHVANPLANPNSRIVPAGVPIHVANPRLSIPGGPQLPDFQQARNFARNGDPAALTNAINGHMQTNGNNLSGMFTAVNALHGINNPAYSQMRASTLALANQQIAQGVNQPMPWVVVAQMSLQDNNPQKFNEATRTLAQKFPNSEYTHFYTGIQHLQNRDFRSAEIALEKARELGMPEESIADLLRVAIDNQKWIWEYALVTAIVVALWLFGLFALFVVGKFLSARTLAKLHRHPPDQPADAPAGDSFLRRLYRSVISLAGFYYYLSLPMVLVVALGLPLTLGYAMLMVPYLNLFLVAAILIVGVGGVITAISGIRTAFVRVQDSDNGRAITAEELPELWNVAREVAEKVGTRPVDEIRLTAGTDLCVYEKGSALARRRDRSQRILVLGAAALRGMKLESLKAILAHEYGHFQNRDTAGGDVALRVNLAMFNFAQAIVKRGKIRWWDVAVHFLRFYHYIFRRLTFGASRLQEVYADRLAVLHYGAAAFREGLTHVIRRSVEFDWTINRSLDAVVKTGRPAGNFFVAMPMFELREREEIETVVHQILDRLTDAEDSHPSPKDRFQLAERIDPTAVPLPNTYAWTLLTANNGIVDEMSQRIEKALDLEAKIILDGVEGDIKYLSRVLRRQFNLDALLDRGRLFLNKGEYQNAIDDLSEILEEAPEAVGVRYLRGIAYKRLKLVAQAIRDFEDVARRVTDDGSALRFNDPDFSKDDQAIVLLALGECHALAGNHAAAIQAYSQMLRRRPSSLAALVARGSAYMAQGDFRKALADFDLAIAHWPGSQEPRIERAKLARLVKQTRPGPPPLPAVGNPSL